MAVRTGAEYLASIRDAREVWLEGERVDPLAHPALAPVARAFADLYDLQHHPGHRDLLTVPSPSSGERVSIGWLLPETVEDLVRRRQAVEHLMRRSGGLLGRLPHHAASILGGIYDARDLLETVDPAFPAHTANYFAEAREADYAVCLAFAEPQRDAAHPIPDDPGILRVVADRPEGVVLRGVKAVATFAPQANELLVLTLPRPTLQPDEVLYFTCPISTPGLKLICREPFTARYPDDHPMSAALDEIDTWVIFDDAVVPHGRVFFRDRPDLVAALQSRVMNWAYHYGVVRMAVKAEVLLGLAVAIGEALGRTSRPETQAGIAGAISFVEVLRALTHEAERTAIRSPGGLMVPNPAQTGVGRIYAIEHEPALLHTLRELCGSGLLMAPREADLRSPGIGPTVERYLAAGDPGAADRFRLLHLAWDYVGDSFAARQVLFDMFNASDVHLNRATLARTYDTPPMVALARRLAGLDTSPVD